LEVEGQHPTGWRRQRERGRSQSGGWTTELMGREEERSLFADWDPRVGRRTATNCPVTVSTSAEERRS
jgi:hypothetical protein